MAGRELDSLCSRLDSEPELDSIGTTPGQQKGNLIAIEREYGGKEATLELRGARFEGPSALILLDPTTGSASWSQCREKERFLGPQIWCPLQEHTKTLGQKRVELRKP